MNRDEEARDARRSAWAGVDALIDAGYGPDSLEYREAWAALELTVLGNRKTVCDCPCHRITRARILNCGCEKDHKPSDPS